MTDFWKPFLACIQSQDPFGNLKKLRSSLIEQGCSQHYVYDIFSSFLQHCIDVGLDVDSTEGNSPTDAVRDILDGIVGWCAADYWAFPDRPYYNPRATLGMTKEQVKEQFGTEPDTTGCGALKGKLWVFGLHEYYFDDHGKLEAVYHRGEREQSWQPIGKSIDFSSVDPGRNP